LVKKIVVLGRLTCNDLLVAELPPWQGWEQLFEPDMERAMGGECVQPGLRVLGLSSGSRAAH